MTASMPMMRHCLNSASLLRDSFFSSLERPGGRVKYRELEAEGVWLGLGRPPDGKYLRVVVTLPLLRPFCQVHGLCGPASVIPLPSENMSHYEHCFPCLGVKCVGGAVATTDTRAQRCLMLSSRVRSLRSVSIFDDGDSEEKWRQPARSLMSFLFSCVCGGKGSLGKSLFVLEISISRVPRLVLVGN